MYNRIFDYTYYTLIVHLPPVLFHQSYMRLYILYIRLYIFYHIILQIIKTKMYNVYNMYNHFTNIIKYN